MLALRIAWLKGHVERWGRNGECLHSPGADWWNASCPRGLRLGDRDECFQDLPATSAGGGDVDGGRLTIGR